MQNKNNHSRFKDAPWYPKDDVYVMVGGAGGIGSWVSMLLARAGFIPTVYDFDLIEEHNIGGQLYPQSKIGSPKVTALQQIIKDFCNTEILPFTDKIDNDSPTHHYCISGFDNMAARKAMFEKWASIYAGNPNAIFIDGRLQAEHMQIFCVTGSSKLLHDKYRKELFDDSEVEDAPCTMKQTSHAAAMIASHMVGFFTNFFTNIVDGDDVRAVPFRWEYFIPNDYIESNLTGI